MYHKELTDGVEHTYDKTKIAIKLIYTTDSYEIKLDIPGACRVYVHQKRRRYYSVAKGGKELIAIIRVC